MTRAAFLLAAALLAIPILLAALVAGLVAMTTGLAAAGPTALADIPPDYLLLYRQAATGCPGLDWALLAAIGKVESDHGRSPAPGVITGHNRAGAVGPMQLLPATFVRYASPPPIGGKNPPSPFNPPDAIYAAARKLCADGARNNADLRGALWRYNHSEAYIVHVLAQATRYRATAAATPAGSGIGGDGATMLVAGRGAVALAYAQGQLGLPYQWGGNGPLRGDAGFDCSGLTTAAWAAAGITLPRTADAQYRVLPALPPGIPLQPGDLLFFGTTARVHHVGIAIGVGELMIDAPDVRQTVRTDNAAHWHDYLSAARPTR